MALNRAQKIFLVMKNYFNEKLNAPPTFPVYTEETARLFGDSECYQRLGCSMNFDYNSVRTIAPEHKERRVIRKFVETVTCCKPRSVVI
ncbi:hypothetical protein P5673_020650 [Acropora cervicornis]|uniref:Uncharacterized protein n=1 Tax=Acropora cervicornis TaxID=6130 RepID=A0AAD9Q9N9_ACRCE|nr:hypothetical protein P5673_020650 [Acropora cervicornis]